MQLKKLIKSITHAGITEGNSYKLNSRILLLNYMCITGLLVSIIFLAINLINHKTGIYLINNLSGQLIFFLTILFNYKRQYRLAVWFCSISFLVFINLISIMNGAGSGAVYLNVVLCISSLLFFEKSREIILISILSFIGFFTCIYIYENYTVSLPNKNIKFYYYIYSVSLFVACYAVVRRYKKEIENYNFRLEKQKNLLQEKNREISDSLFYARNIQKTILKFDAEIESKLGEAFIFFKPRDVVSGDFFWIREVDGKIVGCVADCTGHGVPGALMSMIGATLLRQTVIERKVTDPGTVLDDIRKGIIQLLNQNDPDNSSKDGMDISLCVYDKKNMILEFAGANNDGYLVRKNEITELKAVKTPIGIHPGENQPFFKTIVSIQPNDCLYLFSDGYSDQFGAESGKKYKKKNLLNLLLKHHKQPMATQKQLLEKEFQDWKKSTEQTDDVTIMGVRF